MLMTKGMSWAAALICAGVSVGDLWALEADAGGAAAVEPALAPAADAPAADAAAAEYDRVSLNVQETDLLQVLQMLSIQGQRNIVPSPKVGGTVTANLYDVTFYEALDAILQQNASGFIEKGNFIYIYTIDELEKIKESQQKADHRVFKLHYITAEDAQAFITPLMSGSPEALVAASGPVGEGIAPSESDAGANSWAHYETLIVRDYPANLEEITKVLAELDTPPSQVLVEATVLQASLTDELAFGVDMSILADFGLDDILGLGSPLDIVDDMISGGPVFGSTQAADTASGGVSSTVGNVAEGDAGIKVGILTNNVQIFIRALDQITDTTILANPKIMTLNRQRAEVLVGQKIAYLSTTTSATATTQTVEFLDTGTKLIVRPFVAPDGHVRMELKPSISSAELRDAGGGIILPDEITQELTTNVMVMDGQTVVLGGLFTEQTTISRNQVPGLGNIPIIGNAFKGRDDSLRRDEVIFLITPHIVKDHAIAAAGSAAMEGVDQRMLGAREGLLPWSRTKLTAAHMRDALNHLDAGDSASAMWEVDMALDLDSSMVEAQRLREKLSGERAYWPEQSMLEEATDLMIEKLRGERRKSATPVRPDPALNQMEAVGFGGELKFEPIVEEASAETTRAVEPAAEASAPVEAAPAVESAPAVDAQPFHAQPASFVEPSSDASDAETDWFEDPAVKNPEAAEFSSQPRAIGEPAEADVQVEEDASDSSPIRAYFNRLQTIDDAGQASEVTSAEPTTDAPAVEEQPAQ